MIEGVDRRHHPPAESKSSHEEERSTCQEHFDLVIGYPIHPFLIPIVAAATTTINVESYLKTID